MIPELRLFPVRASEAASSVDAVYTGITWVVLFFLVGISLTILVFLIRYRRGSPASRKGTVETSLTLEMTWVVVPLLLAIAIFGWSMVVYTSLMTSPQSGEDIYVVGKQWMWKVQYPNGRREINSLHVPAGETVRLRMISQDVIHSLYVPAFRLKKDVLPGRYRTLAFEATKPGTYHLFCAEYCGTDHSRMRGTVTVMKPTDYEQWLETGQAVDQPETLAQSGERLFEQQGCQSCHAPDTAVDAPELTGLFGSDVRLADGETVTVDEAYLRTSILRPNEDLVAGYDPLMPSFQGQLSEDQIIALIEYIKSLSEQEPSDHGQSN